MRCIWKLVPVFVVTAFVCVAAVPASASLTWQVCTKLEGSIGSFEDKGCTKAKSEGEYAWTSPRPNPYTVRLTSFTLRITDTKTPGGESTVECNSDPTKDKGGGTIEEGTKGKITSAEIAETEVNTRCRRISGACEAGKIEKIKGVDLPWDIQVEEVGGALVSKIENSGAGEPGWAVTCKAVLVGSRTDTCTSANKEYEELSFSNEVIGGVSSVRGVFKGARKGTCTEGGKESGKMAGLVKLDANGGAGLQVVPPIMVAERTGGAGNGKTSCVFMLKFEPCTIEVKNESAVEEEVTKSELVGVSKAKFALRNDKCSGAKIASKKSCTVEAWATANPAVGEKWNAGYFVEVKQILAPMKRESTIVPLEIKG